MKYVKQCLIILVISLIGEMLKYLIPLPIPASIYGMILLFAGLMTGIIKLEAVRETGTFLIEIMPLMFIPAGVGLVTSWGTLKEIIVPVSIITVVTIVTVMATTGIVSQIIIRKSEENKNE
ncbi:MAG: CidA/LrgA family protein [Agathobacter sp.]|nr:CidA/LrgA family protein [Agathobacter sp.]